MSVHTIKSTGNPDITLTGRLVAHVSSKSTHGECQFRWVELLLYKSDAGSFVCQVQDLSSWDNENDTYSICVCGDDQSNIIGFFGYSDLAKELYIAAGIDATTHI